MRKFKVTASSNSSTLKVTPYVINKGQSGEYYGLKNAEDNQVLTSAPNNWKSKKGAIAWAKKKGYEVVESACGKKSVKASKVDGDDMTLTFITPDLSAATMVAEKAWEIGGFGSTWSEHSWVYIDVPATQSIDNIEELIDYAQNNGVYLNTKSANELDKWLGLVDAACGKKSVKASDTAKKYRIDIYKRDNPDALVKREFKTFDSEKEAKKYGESIANGNTVNVMEVKASCTKKSVRAAHYKAKTGGWNYDNSETNKFLFLYKHRWYTGYKTFDECLADVINTVGIDNIISEGVEISKENSAGYSIERWDSSEVYEAANDVSIAHNKKSVKADWVSKGKKSKISKSFELGDFFLFELGKDFIGISINNSYPEGKSWLGARTISCSDAKGLFDYLRSSLTDDATWNQIERTVANSGFDAKINTMGNFVSDKEMRKPVTSSYNKKSVKASSDGWKETDYSVSKRKFNVKASKSAKKRKAIKASWNENGFAVTGYLGSNRSGVYADRYFGPDEWSEVESYAHELLMQGLYVNIIYFKTGDQIDIDPDVYAENFDGEFVVTNEIADFRDKVWKSMGIGASTKRRNSSKVTAAWYEGGDIVMYFNGEKIYEGQPGADMYDAILPLCQDDETRLKFQEWCNQFGDPLFDDEYGDASETAYTFCELIYYNFVDDENNYEDGNGILDFEIFPATEEVTGTKSVKCASENISAAEYNQMLADMTLGILHDDGYEGIGCAVTDEALSFYDGTEDDVVYIQPTDEITPILGDEDADAEELAAAVKSVAGKAVEATTYDDLEPITGEDEDYGYGFDSNGEAISESTVDELYRIAEREVLPTTELAKVDEYATIMEDTFEYYASSPYVGVTYTISATFDTDDIDVVSYALPDAYHYDFRGGKEVGELEFYIYVKGNEIDKVELIWNSSNLDPNNYDMEAIEEYVKGIAKPAAEAIYNAITNI